MQAVYGVRCVDVAQLDVDYGRLSKKAEVTPVTSGEEQRYFYRWSSKACIFPFHIAPNPAFGPSNRQKKMVKSVF